MSVTNLYSVKKIIAAVGLILCFSAFTNSSAEWKPVGLTMSGGNSAFGVSVYYQISDYDGQDVVLMRLVNHNLYSVKVEWNPAVFTNDHVWIKREEAVNRRSISMEANSEIAADCSGKAPELVFRLKEFPVEAINIVRYGITGFSVTKN